MTLPSEAGTTTTEAPPPHGSKGGAGGPPSNAFAGPPLPKPTAAIGSSPTALEEVDRVVESMKQASIAFNAPKTLNIHDVAQIQLLLSLHRSIEDLQRSVTPPGERQGATVSVSNRMEARLTGTNFAITAITDEEQAIVSGADTEWKWEVAPKETGTQALHLTLTALFDVDGAKTRRTVQTFDRIIEVRVTRMQTLQDFFKKNWQWICTALLIPLGIWIFKKLTSKKQKPRNQKPKPRP